MVEKTDAPRGDLHSSARPGLPCCPPAHCPFAQPAPQSVDQLTELIKQWIHCHGHPVGRGCPSALRTLPTALCMLASAPSRGEEEEGRGTRVSLLPAEESQASHLTHLRTKGKATDMSVTYRKQLDFSLTVGVFCTHTNHGPGLSNPHLGSFPQGISVCQGQT